VSRVFVTDGRSRATPSIVRSLAKQGIYVIVGESTYICSTFFSKYVNKRVIYPDPDFYPEEFADFMYEYVLENELDMIIPVRDSATLILSKYIEKFRPFVKLPLVEYNTMMLGRDKAKTIQLAEKLGIPHPKTVYNQQPEFDEIIKNFKFPLILKPTEGSGSRGVTYVKSSKGLEDTYNKIKENYGDLMIQEFVPHGGGYATSVLLNQGSLRAFFSHKRIREYPTSGGPSTLREGIRDTKLENYSFKLLSAIQWHGVAMVEFRKDFYTNEYKLMEINPRFWGSLSLPIFSGVDFPYLLYCMEMEGDIEPVIEYSIGMRSRWLIGDLLWLTESKNNASHIHDFIKFWSDDLCYDEITRYDPFVLLGAIMEAMVSITKNEKRRYAFERGWDKKT